METENPPLPRHTSFRILVLCTGNRARSQMAHGWLGHPGGKRVAVFRRARDETGQYCREVLDSLYSDPD